MLAQASAKGNGEAAFQLGLRYYFGDAVPKDPRLAAESFRRAQGDTHRIPATAMLASMEMLGDGIPLDVERGKNTLETLTQQFPSAELPPLQLALALVDPRNQRPDKSEALRRFQVAAERGSARATMILARSLLFGHCPNPYKLPQTTLRKEDVTNHLGFLRWLRGQNDIFDPVAIPALNSDFEQYMRLRLPDFFSEIAGLDRFQVTSPQWITNILNALNRLIDGELIYLKERYSNVTLREETQRLLAAPARDLRRLNRLLLEDALRGVIDRREVSQEDAIAYVVLFFYQTGLKRLEETTLPTTTEQQELKKYKAEALGFEEAYKEWRRANPEVKEHANKTLSEKKVTSLQEEFLRRVNVPLELPLKPDQK